MYRPPSKQAQEKEFFVKLRPSSHKNAASDRQTITRRALMPRMCTRKRRDVRSAEIQFILKVSSVQQRNFNASLVISMDTLQAYFIKRNMFLSSQGNKRPICCKWELCMLVAISYAATHKIVHLVMSHSVCK